jgi:hypothetical protein
VLVRSGRSGRSGGVEGMGMEMVLGGVDDMGGDFFSKGREGTGEYGTLIRQREGSPRKVTV